VPTIETVFTPAHRSYTTMSTRALQFKSFLARPAGRAMLGLTTLSMILLSFLFYIGLFNGNVRTVIPQQVYRSAQLSPAHLSALVREHGIRTVISLRGGQPGDHWWEKEAEACRSEGVEFRTVSLRATALPRPEQLRDLLRIFDEAKYPILFHCKSGADRTGMAATLYLHLYQRKPLDVAEREGLTWRYGHFKLSARAMDDFFDLYRRDAGGRDLRSWIEQRYPVVYARIHESRLADRTRISSHPTTVP
jgi:protein tyrosine/serine phosphatase